MRQKIPYQRPGVIGTVMRELREMISAVGILRGRLKTFFGEDTDECAGEILEQIDTIETGLRGKQRELFSQISARPTTFTQERHRLDSSTRNILRNTRQEIESIDLWLAIFEVDQENC